MNNPLPCDLDHYSWNILQMWTVWIKRLAPGSVLFFVWVVIPLSPLANIKLVNFFSCLIWKVLELLWIAFFLASVCNWSDDLSSPNNCCNRRLLIGCYAQKRFLAREIWNICVEKIFDSMSIVLVRCGDLAWKFQYNVVYLWHRRWYFWVRNHQIILVSDWSNNSSSDFAWQESCTLGQS